MASDGAKRVRFANVPPQTPSPSTSSMSLGSSPGPSTPPQLQPPQLPPRVVRPPEYLPWQRSIPAVIPMPMPMLMPTMPMFASSPPYLPAHITGDAEGDIVIDPLIAAPLDPKHPPPLRWDVSEHPENMQLGSIGEPHARKLSHDDLSSCAVRSVRGSPKGLSRMTLLFPGLPFTIEIKPDERPVWTNTSLPYLTVGDVLYGLYRTLRLSVGQREINSLDGTQRESLRRAYEKRLQRDSRQNYERNVRHGIRQVDYLGDMRQFVGLRLAVGAEIPYGRGKGEVFVVKLH